MLAEILTRIDRIRTDNKSGAAVLSFQACQVIEEFAKAHVGSDPMTLKYNLAEVSIALRNSQPEMAPIVSLSQEILHAAEGAEKSDEICHALRTICRKFLQRQRESKRHICAELLNLVEDGDLLFTHSSSSTVRDALTCMHKTGKKFNVIVTESRPSYEGRDLAKKLGSLGIRCTLIVDSAALKHLERSSIVIVGADCVTEKYIVNKVGTLALAMGARELHKKFYVLCDTTKFVSSLLMGGNETPHPGEEILREKYPNITVSNYYFEKIPLSLISGFITEKGLHSPEEIQANIP